MRSQDVGRIEIRYPGASWSGRKPLRSISGGKLIALDEARRLRAGRSLGSFAQQSSLVVLPARDTPEAARPRTRLRGRRGTALPQWLPTVLLVGLAVCAALLFASFRVLGDRPAPIELSPVAQEAGEVLSTFDPPAGSQPVEPGRGNIRFTVTRIEPSYTVVAGDSLSAIAQRHSTTTDAVQGINNLPSSALSIGQRLIIP